MPSLRHLNLKINHWNNGDDLGLISLVQNLKSLTTLESLQLEFIGWHKLTNDSANAMGECLAKQKFLKRLHLNISDCTGVTDSGFQSLAKGFKGLLGLESLTFEASGCERLSSSGLGYFTDGLKRLGGSLKELELHFTKCQKIGDKGLEALARGLKLLSSLKIIRADFMQCQNITYPGAMAFKSSVATMVSIQKTKIQILDEDFE